MKYIKGIIGEKSTTTRNTKGSSSKAKASEGMVLELTEESKMNKKAEEGKLTDWSKFKKVEMFLAIKQETTAEEYQNRFDKLLAPVPFLQMVVLEETFMNGLAKAMVEI
ncbi:transposon Tf2-1 polyprotein isoform X1 [Cucumis melo var. makuwa]|uniref:Transposon Tf2-1 polyprotein isoform X1 n=1 Tax=Cucumis melo var. makuwa TaxID=1194695 RepID=A0A5A7V9F1_CUCMM|nr:transposon Tf2-1 polyprotein isoform X1 [Cucumis melo var. makuwa]TYK27379.1 transposon Tf2-1 polyprotein isoform X1 [Cucumis melo var. makuwa]